MFGLRAPGAEPDAQVPRVPRRRECGRASPEPAGRSRARAASVHPAARPVEPDTNVSGRISSLRTVTAWQGREYRDHLKECPSSRIPRTAARWPRAAGAHAGSAKLGARSSAARARARRWPSTTSTLPRAHARPRRPLRRREETPFKFAGRFRRRALFLLPLVVVTFNSPPYTIWPGLEALACLPPPRPDEVRRGEDGEKLYAVFVNVLPKVHAPGQLRYRGSVALCDSNGKDYVQRGFCGKADGDKEFPADEACSLRFQFALTDEQKARATHTNGTIRIIGSFYFSNTWMTDLDETWKTL